MFVTDCAVGVDRMTADEARDRLVADRNTSPELASNSIEQLRTVAGLCNAGEFDAATRHLPISERKIHGDATDQAILRFSETLGPVSDLKRCWQTKFDLAFNSKNKFMVRVLGLTHRDGVLDAVPTDTAAVFEAGDL